MFFDGQLSTVFRTVPISSFPKPDSMITVRADMTLADAVEVLMSGSVLCAPVEAATEETPKTWRERFVGLLDMSDIVVFVVNLTRKKEKTGHDLRDFRHALAHKAALHTTRVADVMHTTKDGAPFQSLDEATSSLFDAVELLGRGHHHRVLITRDDEPELVNIITQSAVVRVLAQHAKDTREMSNIADQSIHMLGMVSDHRVYSCNVNDEAFSAFQLMKEKNVSAVPVVDMDGKLVGNISNRDIRVLVDSPSVYKQIHSPLHHFLAEVKGSVVDSEPTLAHGDRGAPPSSKVLLGEADSVAPSITCSRDMTLRVVLRRLHVTKIHRLYVTDDEDRPLAVVSLSDILTIIALDDDRVPDAEAAPALPRIGSGIPAGAGDGKEEEGKTAEEKK